MERVIGVDEQGAIVRVFARVGTEGVQLAVEKLDPAVRHGAQRGDTEIALADRTGRADTATDISGARTVYSAIEALCPAGAEFHHTAALSGAHDAVGLGGDQALMIDAQQQHRLDELRLNDRAAHDNDRLAGENGCPLRDSPNIAGKLEMPQIIKKCLAESVTSQCIEILL